MKIMFLSIVIFMKKFFYICITLKWVNIRGSKPVCFRGLTVDELGRVFSNSLEQIQPKFRVEFNDAGQFYFVMYQTRSRIQ
jgi:hypothetical protein